MPINTPHPLYKANIARWAKCRAAYEGEDVVKAAGQEFLPKIGESQTGKDYSAYKSRAVYYEAVSRTIDGFVGAIARKPSVIELPPVMEDFLTDATAEGVGMGEFIKKLCAETLLISRCGILVDYSEEDARSYFSVYVAESILNWTVDSVVLSETVYEPDPADSFVQVAIDQIRQLQIVDGIYNVTLWRRSATTKGLNDWAVFDTVTPTRKGQPLTKLPWFWLSTMGMTTRIEKPPLLGLVNLSFSHYRSSADLEHGRHFTAIPTLWVAGRDSDDPLLIGGSAVISMANPQARVGYAEFTGAGLQSLETALDSKERQMAVLGAAVFGAPKKGVEAAETARIRTSGENSLLMATVSAVEDSLKEALHCAAQWMGSDGEVKLQINRDWVDQSLDGPALLGLVAAYQAGAMTIETFLFNLAQSEMLPPDTDIDSEASVLTARAAEQAGAALKLAAASKRDPTPPNAF
jgi:hypothetical protein